MRKELNKMPNMLGKLHNRRVSGMQLACAVICILTNMAYAQTSNSDEGTATSTTAQPLPAGMARLQVVQTDSPRDTLRTFLELTRELEKALLMSSKNKSRDNANRVALIGRQFLQLFDLSSVPKALQREIGLDTLGFFLDIIGRLDLPPIESVPGADAFGGDESPAKWRIPGSPIWIVRIEDGPREGEFLFSERTVEIAPGFYQRIRHLPLRSSVGIASWTEEIPQWHGPMIPSGLVAALPDSLKYIWLGTPIWKIILVVVLITLFAILLIKGHRAINHPSSGNRLVIRLRHFLAPFAILVVVVNLSPVLLIEINLTGTFARAISFTGTLVIYLVAVWIFWLLVSIIFEWMILSPRISDESLNANLLRLGARVIGFVGGVVILAYGTHKLGFPVLGLVAGLGVGGLAVALAIRPTLENFIGGVILFIDKPVRVGDYCKFGDKTGTVENIGIRSTQVRALDRTLISIPNSAFADMEIINWAECDQMLIHTTIGLRYETDPDLLRYVLVKLREMLHAHPRIDSDTVRVRFAGYSASSLDVDIRVYARTREWNDFYAIREDVFLRVNEIVGESGTGFAFPSQTLYMGRDPGLDKERGAEVKQQVNSWRKSGRLPFPSLPTSKVEQLADTLDYPPHGSPDADPSKSQAWEATEPLSADEHAEEVTEKSESERR
jgi:MscS family membrane protein